MKLAELAALLKHADTCVKKLADIRAVKQSYEARMSYIYEDAQAVQELKNRSLEMIFDVLRRVDS